MSDTVSRSSFIMKSLNYTLFGCCCFSGFVLEQPKIAQCKYLIHASGIILIARAVIRDRTEE